ncbi:hypothetical protein [Microbacterium paraoxydans]|uniref:hypothetical protein n=1 Tax=Microbacterium paraoxydans TaxID=199592 RepID=UPI001CFA523D|nr:hypothetical protein [Microbacterium paraoxydans]
MHVSTGEWRWARNRKGIIHGVVAFSAAVAAGLVTSAIIWGGSVIFGEQPRATHARYAWSLLRHYLRNGANAYMYWNLALDEGDSSR